MHVESVARLPVRWLWATTAALAVVVALVLTTAPAEAAVVGPDQPELNIIAVVDGGTLVAPLASVLPPVWGPFDQPQLDGSTPARWSVCSFSEAGRGAPAGGRTSGTASMVGRRTSPRRAKARRSLPGRAHSARRGNLPDVGWPCWGL